MHLLKEDAEDTENRFIILFADNNSSFPGFLSENKENAVMTAFFSEAQFALRESDIPLDLTHNQAALKTVLLYVMVFYLAVKGFVERRNLRLVIP